MNLEIYYFTGTGNSLVVARDIAKNMNGKLTSIASIIEKKSITPNADIIGIVFPVYYANYGGIPFIVKRFVKKFNNLTSKYVFGVCTHAGGPGRTIESLNKLLKQKGGKLAAGFTVKMSIPYSPILKLKRACFHKKINLHEALIKDSDKQQDLYNAWEEKLDLITNCVSNLEEGLFETTGTLSKSISFPFNSLSKFMFRLRYKQLAELSKRNSEIDYQYSFEELVQFADKSFEVSETCNGCGICSRVCPVGNIKLINNRPIWQHQCETCYACYVWCPMEAIHGEIVAYNKKYHHPEIKISDMILKSKIV